MKIRLISLIALLSILTPCILYAQEYSLSDLYILALERSETIRIAEEDLYISERGKDKAAAALMPTISAFADHTRYSEEKRSGDSILQPEHTNSWGMRLDQTLSIYGKEVTGLRMSKSNVTKSRFDLDAVKEAYIFSVAVAYYDLLSAKKNLEIAESNVERLTRHRDASSVRLEVGEATKTALLRAEAELAGAGSELIRAKNALRFARVVLARRAGISGEYDIKDDAYKIEEDFSIVNCSSSSLDCLKELALNERAEIKAAAVKRDIAEDEVRYAKGSYWPTISLEGVYIKAEDEPVSAFAVDERIYGGLRLDLPLFEGGLRRAEVREAESRLRQADLWLEDTKRSVEIEVDSAYLSLITSYGVLASLKAETEFAADNYNAVSKQFKHGLFDSIDVMDANTLLVTAERELARSRFGFRLSSLGLRRSAGVLLKDVAGERLEE